MSDATGAVKGANSATARAEFSGGDEDGGPMLAADGTPLKKSLNRALRAQKMRALMLIAPLLIFVLVAFIAPILDMLFRSVENQIVPETLPRTAVALQQWTPDSGTAPGDEVFVPFYFDFAIAAQKKAHTRLGTRLNYENVGMSSLFRQSGRRVDDIGDVYLDQFEEIDARWEEPATWIELMGDAGWRRDYADWVAAREAGGRDFNRPPPEFVLSDTARKAFPRTARLYQDFAAVTQPHRRDSLIDDEPWPVVYAGLYLDLKDNPQAAQAYDGNVAVLLDKTAQALGGFETVDVRRHFIEEMNEDWGKVSPWATIKTFSAPYTSGYYLNAVDLQLTADGVVLQPEDRQIYALLFKRTLFMSLVITGSCILLGYPVAFIVANLPMRSANIVMIFVLLPFWTSLLVRTSAWKVMLQSQGVINDVLVWLGLVDDAGRLVMINNQFGTIVAMTHILLPFMILPMYSVMSTIPPSYMRAAKSLGATDWTAFWRVYFPQSVPGIGAGSILVFILSIGYYITPELVGGTTGTFISNRIAYHISSSLNWGLAAALGSILLVVVLILYWAYDKIVGIDNVKLG